MKVNKTLCASVGATLYLMTAFPLSANCSVSGPCMRFDSHVKSVSISAGSSSANETEAGEQESTSPSLELVNVDGIYYASVDGQNQSYSSCKAYLDAGLGSGIDGVYSLNNGGSDYPARCAMSGDYQGFTLVAAQYEDDPIAWNEGMMADYRPQLDTNASFALTGTHIPAHTDFAVTHQSPQGVSVPSYFANFTYTTGNISKQIITNIKGTDFWIHRSNSEYYAHHDPDRDLLTEKAKWYNTLTINKAYSSTDYDWTFAPNNPDRNYRGYAMPLQGSVYDSYQTKPWLIWVR